MLKSALVFYYNVYYNVFFVIGIVVLAATNCVVDLVFVVDSSYLLGLTNWRYLLNFTASIAQRLIIGPTTAQVGFVSYGFFGIDRFFLSTYTNTLQVVNAILSLDYNGDWSNEYSGITQAYSNSFLVKNGNRSYAPNIAVVISAVPHNQGPDPSSAALIAQSQNVKILSVGVDIADTRDVYNISSPPRIQNLTYWIVPSFNKLFHYVDQVYEQICVRPAQFKVQAGETPSFYLISVNFLMNKIMGLVGLTKVYCKTEVGTCRFREA